MRGLESSRLQIRADFLNLFNHFNLGNRQPQLQTLEMGGVSDPTSGKIFGCRGNR